MIVLKPTNSEQTFSIYPRFSDPTEKYVVIRKDGEGIVESLDFVSVSEKSYYTDVTLACNILAEDETYTIAIYSVDAVRETYERVIDENGITENSECVNDAIIEYGYTIWFKDKIYVTSKTDRNVKYEFAQDGYVESESIDDNTYKI